MARPPDPWLLILTGPPGAGKTTVARMLASYQSRSTHVESDWFWTTIATGHIPPWDGSADSQNRTMIRAAAAAALRMVEGGYSTVLDGIVGPWHLDLVRDELGGSEVVASYAVLRPSLRSCLSRAIRRAGDERVAGHPALTDESAVRHMWGQFQDLGEYERYVLDNSGIPPDETVRVLRGWLSRGDHLLGGAT